MYAPFHHVPVLQSFQEEDNLEYHKELSVYTGIKIKYHQYKVNKFNINTTVIESYNIPGRGGMNRPTKVSNFQISL